MRQGSLWRLFRENTNTFLNGILHHVRDDSGFSRPNVGRYGTLKRTTCIPGAGSTGGLVCVCGGGGMGRLKDESG